MLLFLFVGCSNHSNNLGYESDDTSNYVIEDESLFLPSSESQLDEFCSYESTSIINGKIRTFSIEYPKSWEIIQEDAKVSDNTIINLIIMQKAFNEVDFRPNINIIMSKNKYIESTSQLAKKSYDQFHRAGYASSLIGIHNCKVGRINGSVVEFIGNIEGYLLHYFQYIVKKHDNTTCVITLTLDHNNLSNQMCLASKIIESIEFN